jgi:hypothetical protein
MTTIMASREVNETNRAQFPLFNFGVIDNPKAQRIDP